MYNLAGDPRCYESILYLPRPVSKTHLPMPLGNRAAQFSSFDALSGLGAAIQETARQTEARRTLDEDQKSALNAQLLRLRAGMGVTVVYFQPDPRKAGGAYLRLEGSFQKLDPYHHTLCLTGAAAIPVEEIFRLELHTPEFFADSGFAEPSGS